MTQDNCLFCSNEFQSKAYINNTHSFAVFDEYAVTTGHTLVIPRLHYSNWFVTPDYIQQDMLDTINKVHRELIERFLPDGFNVGFNCGKQAGQTIYHTHIHVIPRYVGDSKDDPTGGIRKVVDGRGHY